MKLSFLILGREPSLALAEITARYGSPAVFLAGRDAVMVSGANIDPAAPSILGSVPKAGIILEATEKITAEGLAVILAPFLPTGKKFTFGLGSYNAGGRSFNQSQTRALGLEVKKILKTGGQAVRLVESRSGNLSSVDVVKNKLLPGGGVEVCLFSAKDKFFIGRTESVQPFADYSQRDYDRPGRDMRAGMLPPKLAKAMVNIAVGSVRTRHALSLQILDPFCGSGTVLQEALLMGYACLGTDIDAKAIANSKINLEWLQGKYKNLPFWQFKRADVKELDKVIKPASVDAIVSEFHLGPVLRGYEVADAIAKTEAKLSALYASALLALHKIIKPGGKAVLAWPYFKQYGVFVSAFSQLKKLGWKLIAPFPKQYEADFALSKRGTLLYGRPGQRVFREIIILKKSS